MQGLFHSHRRRCAFPLRVVKELDLDVAMQGGQFHVVIAAWGIFHFNAIAQLRNRLGRFTCLLRPEWVRIRNAASHQHVDFDPMTGAGELWDAHSWREHYSAHDLEREAGLGDARLGAAVDDALVGAIGEHYLQPHPLQFVYNPGPVRTGF